MNLKDQIKFIVDTMPAKDGIYKKPTFYYGREHEANISADDIESPLIVLIEPDQMGFNLNSTTGTIHDTYNTFIQFLDILPEISQDANYRDQTIENMRTLAAAFINRLSRSDIFQDISPTINGVRLVEYYDANFHGIEINIPSLIDILPRPC